MTHDPEVPEVRSRIWQGIGSLVARRLRWPLLILFVVSGALLVVSPMAAVIVLFVGLTAVFLTWFASSGKQSADPFETTEGTSHRTGDISLRSVLPVLGIAYPEGEVMLSMIAKDVGGAWRWTAKSPQYSEVELCLVPEPDNPNDTNAVAVVSEYPSKPGERVRRDGSVGYLPLGHGLVLQEPVRVPATILESFWTASVDVNVAALRIKTS